MGIDGGIWKYQRRIAEQGASSDAVNRAPDPVFMPVVEQIDDMNRNDIQILKESSQVAPYLDRIVALADSNKKSLGFLTKDSFREQTDRGRLWIAVSRNSRDFIGYLLFGGRYPALKIFQIYVRKPHRK